MQIPRVDPKNAAGLVDKLVGLGKEIAGTVLDREQLKKAGQVQQEKGTERLKAVESELDAKSHQAKAASAEQAQRSAAQTKEAVNR
jgi:microcystin-dependent protein